jgi:hypothetical protein
MILVVILYLLQVCVSFWLFVNAGRFIADITLGWAIIFGLLSLLPVAFFPAIIMYCTQYSGNRKPIIVFKKFERRQDGMYRY